MGTHVPILGRLVRQARIPIVVAWLLLAAAAVTLVPSLASLTSSQEASFLPAGTPSRLAADRLAAAFPEEQAGATATVVFARPGATLTDEDRAVIAATEERLRAGDRRRVWRTCPCPSRGPRTSPATRHVPQP